MRILDRAIARRFLLNTVLLLVILFAIIVTIDFSLNYDEFSEKAGAMLRGDGREPLRGREFVLAVGLVLDLWWPRLFQLFNYMLGAVMVGAMGFTFAQMVRHREFVAMLAGGISLHRVIRPVVIVGLLLVTAQAVNNEFILPRIAPLLTRDKKDAGDHAMKQAHLPLTPDAGGRLLYAQRADLEGGRLEGLWVWERDERGMLTRRVTARAATWRDGAWRLEDGLAQRPPGEAGVTPPERVEAIETDLDPIALRIRRFEGYGNHLSTRELGALHERLSAQPAPSARRLDALERVRFGRLAAMGCNLLALLVCLPFFVRREPTSMVAQSLRAAPVALVAVVGGLLATTASIPGLPAGLGVCVPVMVLLPLALAAVTGIRT